METAKSLPVAIIGAGPVGLAAAAYLTVRNQPFVLFEAGDTVAANILTWKHIRVFSPWRYNIDKAARQLLEQTSWQSPDDEALPTGGQLYKQYFKPLADLPALAPHIHLQSKVVAIGRTGQDKMKTAGRERLPYAVQVLHNNQVEQFLVKAVIDTSGTWNFPNPIGSGGTFAIGEQEHRDKIFYGIPDILNTHAERYKNKSVLVVGSGHSSINAVLELDKLKEQYPDTQIHWVLRKQNIHDVYGGQEKDALEARGDLGIKIEQLVNDDRVSVYTPFHIQQVIKTGDALTIVGLQNGIKLALPGIDQVISNTGSRPDFSFLREVRLSIDPSLESVAQIAELIDPNIHSCGTVRPHGEKELRHPDQDFYIAGSKSYGRAPTFLMATGYEQVRSIAAAIDGDLEAAANVELDMPETGVCSVSNVQTATACCGAQPEPQQKPAVASCCG
ncbi:NAD(P)-binding domain-containing protein [Dawidia soli]|uniref:NAD(P)-binding domain-containing protein n=1 Tax=Dawidia soli TaxID=2782352 RepID=A0AAP2GCD2_9BACT|nr:NAD(P)-binding domain-containing protein [Dawidia soli]MBT1686179.1 NAD(P)-binding domain-containing protein [Dawidia soli]